MVEFIFPHGILRHCSCMLCMYAAKTTMIRTFILLAGTGACFRVLYFAIPNKVFKAREVPQDIKVSWREHQHEAWGLCSHNQRHISLFFLFLERNLTFIGKRNRLWVL